ncbi:glycosyltransferase family 4 protein [Geodermatophilus sp. SYSU D00705]
MPSRRRRAAPDRTPHVLLVVENVALGIDIRVRKQVRDLVAAGYRVTVITRAAPENDEYRRLPSTTVLEYPSPSEPRSVLGYVREYAVSFAWAAVHSARVRLRDRVDVLQLSQPPDFYFPLAWVLKGLGATVVVDQRDLMPELLAMRLERPPPAITAVLRWFERETQRVADETVTVNDRLRERLVQAGADPDRVTIVRNGPVLARVSTARPDESLRDGRRFLCCWTGKMGRQDRLDLVLAAVHHVVHVLGVQDVRFVLLGDGECLDAARALSTELRLDAWVSFPGWVQEETVFTHLATADLGMDAALQEEVSPVKVLEYMAFGVPFVAFDLRETSAIGAGAGVLVPPGDVPALAGAIVSLLADPGRRAALGGAGRQRFRDELAWERQVRDYVEVVDRATDRVGRAARAVPLGTATPPSRPDTTEVR